MDLSPAEKTAWAYITANCDNVGVWSPNTKLADFVIGEPIDWEGFAGRCNGNVQILDNGKWWLVDFVDFQYGDLRGEVIDKARLSYVRLLEKHGLWSDYQGACKGLGRGFYAHKDKDKEKDKDKDKSGDVFNEDADEIITHLNETAGSHFKSIDSNRKGIIARLNDGYTVDDCKSVIGTKCAEWLDTDMAKHLNPETLFRPSKFEKYLNQAKIADAPYDDGLRPFKAVAQ